MGVEYRTDDVAFVTGLLDAGHRPQHDLQVPRQPDSDFTTLFIQRYRMRSGEHFGRHAHSHAQLSWPMSGQIDAHVGSRRFSLPPAAAMWIPVNVPHDIGATRPTELLNLYLHVDRVPDGMAGVTAVAMSRLSQALMIHLADGSIEADHRGRVEQVFLELLQPIEIITTDLCMPTDEFARRLAVFLLDHPDNDDTLAAWGQLLGCSQRTLARRFVAETGMTFSDWRAQARVRAAMSYLAEGHPPNWIARRVGYRNASAFIAAFRRATGETPGSAQRRLAG